MSERNSQDELDQMLFELKHNACRGNLGYAFAELHDAWQSLKEEFLLSLGFKPKILPDNFYRHEYVKMVFGDR